jgi:hypothetical protein
MAAGAERSSAPQGAAEGYGGVRPSAGGGVDGGRPGINSFPAARFTKNPKFQLIAYSLSQAPERSSPS